MLNFSLLTKAFTEFNEDKCPRLGAALAYYTVFSLAPLLLLLLWIFGTLFGMAGIHDKMIHELNGLLGSDASEAIKDLLKDASKEDSSPVASVFGFIMLLLGATGVFMQLQDALDTVWEVRREKSSSFFWVIVERWTSLVMVLGIGFLLLVSLTFSAAVSFFEGYAESYLPFSGIILEILHFIISIALTAILFSMMYKILPNVHLPWHCVWIGGLIASVAFTLGKTLIGIYIGQSSVSSSYGAAGSLVVLLLWTYYSAQIFLYGAAFTEIYAQSRKIRITPKNNYTFVTTEQLKQEGIT